MSSNYATNDGTPSSLAVLTISRNPRAELLVTIRAGPALYTIAGIRERQIKYTNEASFTGNSKRSSGIRRTYPRDNQSEDRVRGLSCMRCLTRGR